MGPNPIHPVEISPNLLLGDFQSFRETPTRRLAIFFQAFTLLKMVKAFFSLFTFPASICLFSFLFVLEILGAPTETEESTCRIIDFGHDWGTGWYRSTPEKVNNPSADLVKQEGDHSVRGWLFSLTEPLSPTLMSYDYTLPSARFYGGVVIHIQGTPEGLRVKAPTEGFINPNHELRDDWNMMIMPSKEKTPEVEQYQATGLWLWKKEDFLNGGDKVRVSFNSDGYIGVYVSRYWGGIDWGRWVIMQNGTLYVSETTFAGENRQFQIGMEGKMDAATNPVVRHTLLIHPTETKWAVYKPSSSSEISFDEKKAIYETVSFQDVEAVGFIAQRNLSQGHPVSYALSEPPHGLKEAMALKFNAVQVVATLKRKRDQSPNVDLVPVQPGLLVGKTEVTYTQWLKVWRWAVTNQRTRNFPHGSESLETDTYVFERDGAMGSMETGFSDEHSPQEPVTGMTWYDAVTWCNALSELEGLTPAYYEDAEFKKPFRQIFNRNEWDKVAQRKAVYWNKAAPGYRLPTQGEMVLLTALGKEAPYASTNSWNDKNSENRTHAVALKKPNALGLHDLYGNVAEYLWGKNSFFDPTQETGHDVFGGSFQGLDAGASSSLKPFGERPSRGSCDIGFRVCRGAAMSGGPSLDFKTYPPQTIPNDLLVKPSSPLPPEELKKLAAHILKPVPFEKIGSLQDNNDFKKTYMGEPSYALQISAVEIPYKLWNLVRQWAEQTHGYRFNFSGDMGSMQYTAPHTAPLSHSQMEPVTNISWIDAVVWCNALSELMGLDPVYLDEKSGQPLRVAGPFRLAMYSTYAYPNRGAYKNRPVDTTAFPEIKVVTTHHGFRLPTREEMNRVKVKAISDEKGWFLSNSNGKTHPVGSKPAEANGLFDLNGNVSEWTYGGDGLFGENKFGNHFAYLFSTQDTTITDKEYPFVGRSYLGFRVVRRGE